MVNDMSKAIHEIRSGRLADIIADRGWDALVLYGNAWQCDYLRYATDYVCIEGNAIAVAMKDGGRRLFVESPLKPAAPKPNAPGLTCPGRLMRSRRLLRFWAGWATASWRPRPRP